MAKTTVRHVAALFAGLSLLAAACGSDNGSSSDTTGAPATEAPTTAATATTEAAGASTTAAAAGGGTAGALAGMKGTTPLVELSQGFKDKLLKVDPALKDFNYAAETYDAVTIIALAAEKAKSDGIDYAKEINGITRQGEKCTDYASCKAVIDKGGDPGAIVAAIFQPAQTVEENGNRLGFADVANDAAHKVFEW